MTITEIVEFGKKKGITDEEFIKVCREIPDFYFNLPDSGIKTYNLVQKDDLWAMVIDWESAEQEKKASNLMVKSPQTEKFRNSLDLSLFCKRVFTKVD